MNPLIESRPIFSDEALSASSLSSRKAHTPDTYDTPKDGSAFRSQLIGCRNEFIASLGPWLSFTAVGFYFAFTSPAMAQLQEDGSLTASQANWFASIYYFGGLLGGCIAGIVSDTFGRKMALLLGGTVAAIGWLLTLLNFHYSFLLIGRLFCGFDAGVTFTAGIPYQVETQHFHSRGFFAVFNSVCISTGQLLCFLMTDVFSWRWLAVIAIGFDLVFVNVMVRLPESPRWCVKWHLMDEATASLTWLRMVDSTLVGEELKEIEDSLRENAPVQRISLKAMLLEKRYVGSLLLVIVFNFALATAGYNAIMAFLWEILAEAGMSNIAVSAIIISIIQLVATAATALITDQVNRRTMILSCSTTVILSLLLLSLADMLRELNPSLSRWITLCGVVGVVSAFSSGWHGVGLLAASEILPTAIRGIGSGVGMVVMYTFKFTTVQSFRPLESVIQASGTFGLFAVLTAVSTLVLAKFLPETRGKTLEEIQKYFE